MKSNYFKPIINLILLVFVLSACTATGTGKKVSKGLKHDTPLIKDDVKKLGKAEVDKTVKMGPTPAEADVIKLKKRKKISSVKEKNYLLIPDEFTALKQQVTFKFQNMDYSKAMGMMAEIGGVNILIGDDVAGAITAELKDVPWDKAFNALLDMKNFAADIDVASNIIRVATPATLTSQESYKSARAQAVKKKVELEDSVEPIISEIFRLYYISPAEAKATIIELFTSTSIIVRGKEKDLDVVDKVVREIDVRTKQVLMEIFIVTASSDFEDILGARLGAAFTSKRIRAGGTQDGSSVLSADGAITDVTGSADDALFDTRQGAANAGIGVLRRTGTAVLKAELQALQSQELNKIISNPKIFSLDNQTATIKQGQQIPLDGGEGADSFVDAALVMTVTPSIIGDGNVLLDVKVNNDSPQEIGNVIGIDTMEISTKLLVADGDIVVIGGIKSNTVQNNTQMVPGMSKLPVVGKMFKGKQKTDSLNELLVFIAPRIL